MQIRLLSNYFLSLSNLCLLAFIMLSYEGGAQELAQSLEFNQQRSINVFSGRTNRISGYTTGKFLAYTIYPTSNINANSIGIAFDYSDMSKVRSTGSLNAGTFGSACSLIGVLDFSLLQDKNLRVSFSPGIGLSYITETWHTNRNKVFVSHFNFAARASLKIYYGVNSDAKIVSGIDIMHFSNGGTRNPNSGMNIFGVSLGMEKYFSNPRNGCHTHLNPDNLAANTTNFELGVNIGLRGVYYRRKNLYKSGIYLGYTNYFNSFLGLNTSLDGVYYYSVFDSNHYAETFQSKATSLERWRLGAGIGPVIDIGELALSVNYVYYLYYHSYYPVNTYWTMNFKYKLNKRGAINAKLYGHKEEVDFLGLGYVFNWEL